VNGADALASDEDEIDEATLDYLDAINKSDRDSGNDPGSCVPDEDDDDDESWDGETDLEAFETPIDAPTSDDEEDEDGVADTSLTQRVMRRALRGNVVDEFVLFRNVMQRECARSIHVGGHTCVQTWRTLNPVGMRR
jgi:hypothetical protein